jgi:hypothetical protein
MMAQEYDTRAHKLENGEQELRGILRIRQGNPLHPRGILAQLNF